jgi:hypothetical protein
MIRMTTIASLLLGSLAPVTSALGTATGLDTIYATSSADGEILALLRKRREVVMIGDGLSPPYVLGPVVVSAADLDDPGIVPLLKDAYKAGRTVAIVDATEDEADRLQRLVGAGLKANCEPATGERKIGLYGLQESVARRPRLSSSYCLIGVKNLSDSHTRHAVRRWLQARFAHTAPEPGAGEPADDSNSILDLANATHCSQISTADPAGKGRQMQVDLYVTGARSFAVNNDPEKIPEDIYYVENKLQYQQGQSSNPNYAFAVSRVGATDLQQFEQGVSDAKPDSVSDYVSSVTNTTTTMVSGSVGFNAMGPTATIGGSITHGQSKTVTFPPIQITNNTTSIPPLPKWTFKQQTVMGNEDFEPETSWFWTVPMDTYADQGRGLNGSLSFRAISSMGGEFNDPLSGDFAMETTCNVAYPFGGLWSDAVGNPTITSLSSSTVEIGHHFTITGKELYPGLITAVFLQGTAIDIQNVTPQGETSPGSGDFTVDVLVPSETNGADTQTGFTTVDIQTTFQSTPVTTKSGLMIDIKPAD